MQLRRFGTRLAALALVLTCTMPAFAQTTDRKGTIFDAKINTELSSKTSQNGDPFTLSVTGSFFHPHKELQGATIDGHLENVTPASSTHKATMNLIFDDITFADGTKQPISVVVNKLSQVEPKTHHLRDVGLIIGGAVTGHIISKKTGHGGGTLAGAAAGFALASSLKSDIDLKPGTIVQLKLKSSLDVPAAA